MGVAVVLVIFASFLSAITNHIDKFIVCDVDELDGVKILLVFSTLIAGSCLLPFWIIHSKFSVSISTISLMYVLLSAFVYVCAIFFYFKALEKNDASTVIVMSQLYPVVSYIFGLILFKESLALKQIVGGIIIILSSILVSIDFNDRNSKKSIISLILVSLSMTFYVIYLTLFDIGIRNSSYNSCAFWFQIGLLILGIIFICIKSFRVTFINAIKNNGKKYFSLNITNEVINLVANLLVNYANVMLPLALVSVLNGFQGAFVFVLGVIGVKLLPKYFKENLSKRVIIQKVGCIILSIIGLIIMFI